MGAAAGVAGTFNIVITTGDRSFCGKRKQGEKLNLLLDTQERYFFTLVDLSSMLLGRAILTERPMSFQVTNKMKIVFSE